MFFSKMNFTGDQHKTNKYEEITSCTTKPLCIFDLWGFRCGNQGQIVSPQPRISIPSNKMCKIYEKYSLLSLSLFRPNPLLKGQGWYESFCMAKMIPHNLGTQAGNVRWRKESASFISSSSSSSPSWTHATASTNQVQLTYMYALCTLKWLRFPDSNDRNTFTQRVHSIAELPTISPCSSTSTSTSNLAIPQRKNARLVSSKRLFAYCTHLSATAIPSSPFQRAPRTMILESSPYNLSYV